jgi:putative ABC transport system ATP-binding protein
MSPGSDPVVTLVGVTRSYGQGRSRTVALHGVDLELCAGEVLALVGRSGSGKSTVCHLVAGLERATAGRVLVAGRPADDEADWATVALLPQRLGLADELTVAENAFLPCWLRGRDADPELLAMLDLAALADRAAGATSLGEQQRTALLRALSVRPAVAVLDEPTGHQDDENVDRVVAALEVARSRGSAVLVATHDERVVAAATRVVRLEAGRIAGGSARGADD